MALSLFRFSKKSPACLFALLSGFLAPSVAAEKTLLWGDTHVHSYLSPDAFVNQNFTIGPDEAFKFAKGLPVIHPSTHTRVQLETPLDFLVVADHAESMGVFKQAYEEGVPTEGLGLIDRFKAWVATKGLRYLIGNPDSMGDILAFATPATQDVIESAQIPPNLPVPNSDKVRAQAWQESITAADANNEPGRFTAFIGWEWSSIPAAANLHRVIFTNTDATVARQYLPFASSTSNYPEDLWQWLNKTAEKTGADFVAIPHNSNISRGYMFPESKRLRDTAIDKDWIALRAKWETVVEATQVKGDSETDPALSPNDPFADFEPFPYYLKPSAPAYNPQVGDFVRSGLLTGLKIQQDFGINPYRFGLIGSTDSHTGLATAEEANFWGKMATDSTPESKSRPSIHIDKLGWTMSASGLAAVWATDNTRQAIMDAFKRREVYASTGPRIAVRVYAGDFQAGDELKSNIYTAFANAVPMGGNLPAQSQAPSLLIHAAKDPKSAHLDRIQVIKGWINNGNTFERIYDVAWSGERTIDSKQQVPAVTNTVNLQTGEYSNQYGATMLSTVWRDPDFDSSQAAFYYVRVLEIPTPRHSTLDAIALGIPVSETAHAATLQERAYTSPIFYQPQ